MRRAYSQLHSIVQSGMVGRVSTRWAWEQALRAHIWDQGTEASVVQAHDYETKHRGKVSIAILLWIIPSLQGWWTGLGLSLVETCKW